MVAGPERSRGSTSSSPASAWPARPFLYDPAFAVIIRWFHRQRANALLAATQFAGLANALFERLGWRDTPLVLAATLACLIILPHWLVRGDASGRWSATILLTASTALAESRMQRPQLAGATA